MGKLSLFAEDFTRTCHRTFHLVGKVKHLLLPGCCPAAVPALMVLWRGSAISVGHLGCLWRGAGKWKDIEMKRTGKKKADISGHCST
jgi:hypothetical protein